MKLYRNYNYLILCVFLSIVISTKVCNGEVSKINQEPSQPVMESEQQNKGSEPSFFVQDKSVNTSSPASKDALKIKADHKDSTDIVFNFDNADLYEVIQTVAEILNLSYIMDPKVAGKVTIHTEGGLKKEDLFPIFLQLLDVNGLTAVKEGSLYRITYLKDAPRMSLSLRFDDQGNKLTSGEDTIIQIIPLRYIHAPEMAKILVPFITEGGIIIPEPASNSLLVVDRRLNIIKILKLVESFDINLFARVMHRFYFLENMDAEEMVKILGEALPMYINTGSAEVKFISIKRLNSVLALSQDPQIFDKVADFISQLDVVDQEVEPRIYVYFVRNGEAKQLAEVLKEVFSETGSDKTKTKTEGSSVTAQNPLLKKKGVESEKPEETKKESQKKEKEPESPSKKSGVTIGKSDESAGTLGAEIKIIPDETRNALIIQAVPTDYRTIENILERIDVLPRQVLIEATIAEITLDDENNLGIEWSYTKDGSPGSGLLSATMGESGLAYSIGIANRVKADISAFAKDHKVNILSSPHILASDNKEAKIDISNEIPVASSNYEYTSSENPVIATNIQYRDTGVILSVTPHINDRGLVTMEISQEVSEVSNDVKVAGQDYPSFYKRNISTTLTVKHGQTIVIGGLIKENSSDTAQGTPCLVSIPVIRYLFGKDSKEFHKTELIVLLTPRVVVDLEDVNAVTEDFKHKVDTVIKKFSKYTH